jgi:hypothetical protein
MKDLGICPEQGLLFAVLPDSESSPVVPRFHGPMVPVARLL